MQPAAPAAAAHRALQSTVRAVPLTGFGNIFRKELGDWFHTRRWWVQLIIWLMIFNGFLAFILFAVPTIAAQQGEAAPTESPLELGLQLLTSFAVIGGPIGAIILAQDEVVEEKKSGTAAWILSKPLSRAAFLLSKFAAQALGTLLFIVLVPTVVGYFEMRAAGALPNVVSLAAAMALVYLTILFYTSLALMLGVFFDGRGPVIGITLGLLFLGSLLVQMLPASAYVLPVGMQQITAAVAMGQPLPPVAAIEIAATALWTVLFVVVAVLRFRRLEL
jgi:ABC-2 type transport system permease protein